MIIIAATAAAVINDRITGQFQRENAKSLPVFTKASLVVLVVNNPPANAGDIRDAGSIPRSGKAPGGGRGNLLQYSCWEIPWTQEPGGLQSMGSQRVGHDWVT